MALLRQCLLELRSKQDPKAWPRGFDSIDGDSTAEFNDHCGVRVMTPLDVGDGDAGSEGDAS